MDTRKKDDAGELPEPILPARAPRLYHIKQESAMDTRKKDDAGKLPEPILPARAPRFICTDPYQNRIRTVKLTVRISADTIQSDEAES